MFRASLGQLSDFPRSFDYLVTVRLRCKQLHHVLGEPLCISYSYRHDDDARPVEGGPSPSLAQDSLTDGSVEDVRHPGKTVVRRHPHSSTDWIGLFTVLPDATGALWPESAAGSMSMDARSCLNEHLDFGDCTGECAHTEKLLAWCIVPESNRSTVMFEGVPKTPGVYRVRYFLNGSQASTGNTLEITSQFVHCQLTVPSEIQLGSVLPVTYSLSYSTSLARASTDWIGLYVISDEVKGAPASTVKVSVPKFYFCTDLVLNNFLIL